MSKLSIQVEGLSKKLGPNQALDGLSTTFEAGHLHGLIGPDGAGKTTLMRHLMGLLKGDRGTVAYRIDKKPVPFATARPGLAYMPQSQSLYSDLSIDEHLDFFRDLYDLDEKVYQERRKRLLHLTRLDRFIERPAGKLSGGMYKKLGLMCSLLASPQALLLDEPTNGVDPVSRREFWALLAELLGSGILVLVATAYMDEAERCDKVHLIFNGKLLDAGEPRLLLKKHHVPRFDELFVRAEEEHHKKAPAHAGAKGAKP
jgi:ABC-2 type transport system ATP-binding protein